MRNNMKKITLFSIRRPALPIAASVIVCMLSVGCLGIKTDKTAAATEAESALVGESTPVVAQTAAAVPEVTAPAYVIGENATNYEIVSGDSLSVIAQKHGTTISAIKAANNLTSDKIVAGKTLTIPSAQTATESNKDVAEAAEDTTPEAPESKLSILEKSDEEIEKASEGVRRAEAPDMTNRSGDSLSPRTRTAPNSDPVSVPPAPTAVDDFIPLGQ
jgi:LysM repeat protein